MERLSELLHSRELNEPANTLNLNIEGLSFDISATKQEQIEYIKRIAFPQSKTKSSLVQKAVEIYGITTSANPLAIFPELPGKIIDKDDNFIYSNIGTSLFCFFYSRKDVCFANFTEEGENRRHICVGPNPELGISSFIKVDLLHFYAERFPQLIIFHAGSVLSNKSSVGVVFASPGIPREGDLRGKTTAVLSCSINPNKDFSYCSNDEVIFAIDPNTNTLIYLPFPNEIPLREGTLRAIRQGGYDIALETLHYFDSVTREYAFITTPAAISESGFNIKHLENIRLWISLDLSPLRQQYNVRQLSNNEAEARLKNAIFQRRMAQARGNIHWAELGISKLDFTLREQDYQTAEKIFRLLSNSGVKFLELSGGVERKKITEITKSLLNEV